ncbi:uncharacterized protein JCM15063_000569 [Sporobolomyces koalae]|uniref:uncharacterized protein n=1 Tax=Sporobolomyces koalae TaxID=500713 RepID=UPI0031738D14
MVASKSPILSCHPGSLNSFALKLRSSDTLESLKERCARKLALPPGETAELDLKYLWCDVYYSLEDEDDFAIFAARHSNTAEVQLLLSSPSIPTSNPSIASLSSIPPSSSFSSPLTDRHLASSTRAGGGGVDSSSVYSSSNRSYLYGRAENKDLRSGTSMHLVSSSEFSSQGAGHGAASIRSGRTGKSAKSTGGDTATIGGKSKRPKSLAPTVPEHKIKFEEFHNQLGVRTFIGSIGPVENVRMMMKSGHRACYMSRAFAQQHNFIPADAAPGFYGFSGITNLGVWPIKVGSKTVEQQVMLVESSYFPVILGRSFMERRGVRTDPLDQTSVVFMDTNEAIPTDLVIVKDKEGRVVPIS